MRGVTFHIISESKIDNYTAMSASDFDEYVESMGIESVQDQHPVDAKNSVERLISRLRSAGFEIDETFGPDEEKFFVFRTGSEEETMARKCQYFAAAFAKLQEMVSQMSLETFASDGLEEYQLRMLIKNTDGDMVYYGDWMETTLTLDGFIRRLTPGSAYCIAPETVYMR